MGITKNKQSIEVIQKMTEVAFDGIKMKDAVELTEGLCNVAYSVTLEDGRTVILKIAPKDESALLFTEVNMMQAEVDAMEIASRRTTLPIPKVYFYDDSLSICDSTYFFMEKMDGKNFITCKGEMPETEIRQIYYEIGKVVKDLSRVKGEKFGLFGDKEHWTIHWFDTFYRLLEGIFCDADRKSVDYGIDRKQILKMLEVDKEVFEEVKQPCMIHWDLWEGNIFVKDGHLSGIIDWERAIWAEPLMEDRFRRHSRNQDFLRGYGKVEFTKAQQRRIAWYDIFLYSIMMVEGAYRCYEDDSQYQWVHPLFLASLDELNNKVS